ncbi:MAG: rhomboid family intramembrane serine protease [Spirochaetaceae bacterium]|jgi:membrane associated rhomboid family serine protease|nr:rhomboid family intramembrane serine protease [Spirochaetaceae bacterium]
MKIKYNAPVLLSFVFACAIVLLLANVLGGGSVSKGQPLSNGMQFLINWFAVPGKGGFDKTNFRNWVNLVSHVLGHEGLDHLTGNLLMILVVGPMLEEIYGSLSLLLMILITALTTGVMNIFFGPGYLLGASGVVFMMILLASFTNFREGEIPLTFILVMIFYLGNELVQGISRSGGAKTDNISHFTHILGGICGSLFGFFRKGKKPLVAKEVSIN